MTNQNNGANGPNKSTAGAKAYVMPESVKVKISANRKFKDSVFSASGLVKFAKSPDGRKIIQPYLDNINKKHSTSFRVEKIDTRLFKQFGTPKELNLKTGEPKKHFSFWMLLTLVNRKCKADAASSKSTSQGTTSINNVEQKKEAA